MSLDRHTALNTPLPPRDRENGANAVTAVTDWVVSGVEIEGDAR
jgi:hypothetical protein